MAQKKSPTKKIVKRSAPAGTGTARKAEPLFDITSPYSWLKDGVSNRKTFHEYMRMELKPLFDEMHHLSAMVKEGLTLSGGSVLPAGALIGGSVGETTKLGTHPHGATVAQVPTPKTSFVSMLDLLFVLLDTIRTNNLELHSLYVSLTGNAISKEERPQPLLGEAKMDRLYLFRDLLAEEVEWQRSIIEALRCTV